MATSSTSTSSSAAPVVEEEDDEALFAALEAELDLDLGTGAGEELRQDAGTEHRGFLASGDGSRSGSGSGGAVKLGSGFDLEGYRERRMRELREE